MFCEKKISPPLKEFFFMEETKKYLYPLIYFSYYFLSL